PQTLARLHGCARRRRGRPPAFPCGQLRRRTCPHGSPRRLRRVVLGSCLGEERDTPSPRSLVERSTTPRGPPTRREPRTTTTPPRRTAPPPPGPPTPAATPEPPPPPRPRHHIHNPPPSKQSRRLASPQRSLQAQRVAAPDTAATSGRGLCGGTLGATSCLQGG